jgi:hypothetical protein
MTLKLALDFAAAGFPVFPVDVFYDPDRKRWRKVPCIREWETRATTNPTLIQMWWRQWPCAMPGIPPGRCGKVVVDADRHDGGTDGVKLFHELDHTRGPFPVHPYNPTKGGGEHHWFAQPATAVRWAKWGGGEVLGHGRFVVGYAVPEGECPVLPELFRQAVIAEDRAITHTHAPLLANSPAGRLPRALYIQVLKLVPISKSVRFRDQRRMCGILSVVVHADKGTRNHRLFWAACRFAEFIARGRLGPDVAEQLLFAAANGLARDDGEQSVLATIASGLRNGSASSGACVFVDEITEGDAA